MSVFDFDEAMYMCYQYASLSPDPSTQNAAVLLDDRGPREETLVFNGFPRGIRPTPARWERPLKYDLVIHAELGSLLAAAREGIATDGLTMVCPWAPCTDCARAIIQAGIVRLVRRGNSIETNERWQSSVAFGDQLLGEAGVKIVDDASKYGDLPPILRDGQLVEP